ncbi:hypothetical protein HK102_002319 [Quaeritorhiza haematococci]|nr:hypothetical protein HK102_002319 [Quaeritorhiza haematococci]
MPRSNILTALLVGTALLQTPTVQAGSFLKDPAADRDTFGTGATIIDNKPIFYLPRSFESCSSLNDGTNAFHSTWLKFQDNRLQLVGGFSDQLGQAGIGGWTFVDIESVRCHTNGGLWSEWRVTNLKENYGTSMKAGGNNQWVTSGGSNFPAQDSEIYSWDYCARPEVMRQPPRARLINKGGFNYIVVQNADGNTWHCMDAKTDTIDVGVETPFNDPNNPPEGCSRFCTL